MAFARFHAFDVGLERIVIERIDLRLELLDILHAPYAVLSAEDRIGPAPQQAAQHPFLRFDGMPPKSVDRPQAGREKRAEYPIAQRHFY